MMHPKQSEIWISTREYIGDHPNYKPTHAGQIALVLSVYHGAAAHHFGNVTYLMYGLIKKGDLTWFNAVFKRYDDIS